MNVRGILLQVPVYAAFAAWVGYCSSAPPYRHLAPGESVLKVSLSHAGERKQACRERSAEELAKLAPNMRAAQECPRERSDVVVEVEMDGRVVLRESARAGGLHHDLPSTIYRRLVIPAGDHAIRARMADTADGAFRHVREARVAVAPARVLVIDFDPGAGGFVFLY